MTSDNLREAEQFFHARIPLTNSMGIRVVPDATHHFAIEAPVARNSNHLQTAFGGSINALATLAGYGFLWLELRGLRAHVVIASSSIQFVQPIREKIRAVCIRPADEALENFKAKFQSKGKARIALRVLVSEADVPAAEFNATFVAYREP